MPRYSVTLYYRCQRTFEVEADDEDEAVDKAEATPVGMVYGYDLEDTGDFEVEQIDGDADEDEEEDEP